MTKDDFIIIEEMIKLKEMDMAQKEQLAKIIRTYIDSGFSMCYTCDPQIRQAFKRLCDWWRMKREDFYQSLFIETKKNKIKKNGNN